MMPSEEGIKSREFRAPFVRVRGRLSRGDEVTWDPCVRTFKAPRWVQGQKKGKPEIKPLGAIGQRRIRPDEAGSTSSVSPGESGAPLIVEPVGGVVVGSSGYTITFEDGMKKTLAKAPTTPRFFAHDQTWATFVQRLPYHRGTERVVLWKGEEELGALHVPTRLPKFTLMRPLSEKEIDIKGVMHLFWKEEDTTANKKLGILYFVRYSGDQKNWARVGVNLTLDKFGLDLREMAGGGSCSVQVIGTNGYQTAFVETPRFQVPEKPPQILLGETRGPVLFAQGFSKQSGPIIGDGIVWLDGKERVGTGGSFDVRILGRGVHKITVNANDERGNLVSQLLGLYDGETGLMVTPGPGL